MEPHYLLKAIAVQHDRYQSQPPLPDRLELQYTPKRSDRLQEFYIPMSSIFSPSLPTDGYHTCWQGLNGSAESLALVQAAIRTEGLILLICDTNESVERYLRELSYLSSELNAYKVFALPDWETLPYDSFSPHIRTSFRTGLRRSSVCQECSAVSL